MKSKQTRSRGKISKTPHIFHKHCEISTIPGKSHTRASCAESVPPGGTGRNWVYSRRYQRQSCEPHAQCDISAHIRRKSRAYPSALEKDRGTDGRGRRHVDLYPRERLPIGIQLRVEDACFRCEAQWVHQIELREHARVESNTCTLLLFRAWGVRVSGSGFRA